MAWTAEQQAELFENVWRDGQPDCPTEGCAVPVDVNMLPAADGGFGEMGIHCKGCGESARFTRADDPKAGAYRDWTTQEVKGMGLRALKGETITCPGDGSDCEVQHNVPIGGSTIVGASGIRVICRRCGREFTRPNQ
jgi:hypothetical protein